MLIEWIGKFNFVDCYVLESSRAVVEFLKELFEWKIEQQSNGLERWLNFVSKYGRLFKNSLFVKLYSRLNMDQRLRISCWEHMFTYSITLSPTPHPPVGLDTRLRRGVMDYTLASYLFPSWGLLGQDRAGVSLEAAVSFSCSLTYTYTNAVEIF